MQSAGNCGIFARNGQAASQPGKGSKHLLPMALWRLGVGAFAGIRSSGSLNREPRRYGRRTTQYDSHSTCRNGDRIGSISIPKLGDKLEHDQRVRMRKLAVFCSGSIEGRPRNERWWRRFQKRMTSASMLS